MSSVCAVCKYYLPENIFAGRYPAKCSVPPENGWGRDHITGGEVKYYDSCWSKNSTGKCKDFVKTQLWWLNYFK